MRVLVSIIFLLGSLLPGTAFGKTQAELDQACEDARSRKLQPIRQQKIKECKADKKNDPKWCEQFYADYGDGGRDGPNFRKRKFDNLPECVKAEKARQDVN